MRVVYCANCGMPLKVQRRPLARFGRILDVIPYHECPEEPLNIDLANPIEVPHFEGKDKFVKKLNELPKPSPFGVDTVSMGDQRRSEDLRKEINSTAPGNLLRQIRDLPNSVPTKDLKDPEE